MDFEHTSMAQLTTSPRFVFILGMHRSGTSCLAGSLERCGLFLGPVSRFDRHNIKGNHEIRSVVTLNQHILKANGGDWSFPPVDITLRWQHKLAIRAVVAWLSIRKLRGLKDPRLLLLLKAWLEVIPSFALVGTFRHPAAVANSLARRNGMSLELANRLWLHYNTELIRWHKRFQFPIIEFNLADVEAYRSTIAALAKALRLRPDMVQLKDFIEAGLDHYAILDDPIPDICHEVYAYLQTHRYMANYTANHQDDIEL